MLIRARVPSRAVWIRWSIAVGAAAAVAVVTAGHAQTLPLRSRPVPMRAEGTPSQVGEQSDASTLPPDASATYILNRRGDRIEITLVEGRLEGYVSHLGDRSEDHGAPLTYFFDETSVKRDRLSFSTKQVHAVWYSFEGTIVHGEGLSRGEEGAFLLVGTLRMHRSINGQGKSSQDPFEERRISCKSMRQSPVR